MAQTLLAICQQASREMGITAPATIISNTDLYAVQLLNLVNGLGQDLQREYEWQGLSAEHRFYTVFYQYTADVVSGNTTISNLSSTTGLTATPTYFLVTGNGIPQDTYLVSVNGGAGTAVLSNQPTTSGTTVTLTFSQVKYAFPADFDRLRDRTEWDKTDHWELLGPATAPQWQWLKSGYIATGPRLQFRQMGSLFQIYPGVSSNLLLGFEYLSNFWAAATGAALSKSAFTVDTDTCVYPDKLMVEGLKLRFRIAKGTAMEMHTPEDIRATYPLRTLDIAKAADAGSATLSMSPRPRSILIGPANIPDANYNL